MACSALLLRLWFRFGVIGDAGLFGRDNTLNDNRLCRLLLRRHLDLKIDAGLAYIRFHETHGVTRNELRDCNQGYCS